MSSVNLISVLAIPSARLLIKLLNITGAITGSLRILLSPFLKFHSKPLITVLFVQLYNQVFAHLRGILWGKYCRLYQKNCKNRAIWCLLLLTCNCYIFYPRKQPECEQFLMKDNWWLLIHLVILGTIKNYVYFGICSHRYNTMNQNSLILNIFLYLDISTYNIF